MVSDMNEQMIGSTIRTLLGLATGWIVGTGMLPPELWAQIVPVIVAVGVWGWGVYNKKQENQIEAVAKMNDVKKVVMESATKAEEQPNAKITAK